MRRSLNEKVDSDRCESSESVRKPCAMVLPNGEFLARSRSTWIHWKSSIAFAKLSMRSCVISNQGETPTSSPTRCSRLRMVMAVISPCRDPGARARRARATRRHAAVRRAAGGAGGGGAAPRCAGRIELVQLGAQRFIALHLAPQRLAGIAEALR